jgi:hypothetical protein
MVVTAYVAKISDRRSEMNYRLNLNSARCLQFSRIWGRGGGEDVVGRYRSANALQFKLANRLDRDGVFDCHQDTRAYQYLTGLCFVAEPRSNVGHRPDGGIVETALEADSPQCSKSVRYPNAEPNIVPKPTPLLRQFANCIAHFEGRGCRCT